MDKYYKVPNVYIEEVSTSASSISNVSSCVPVFIGYTEKATDGENDLRNKPTLITSLLDYQTFFGNPAPCNFIASVFQGEIFLELESQFLLYYTLQFFFDNGGSNCYIISIGNYFIKGQGDFQQQDFDTSLQVLQYEDEPNLILLTDAINLEKDKYYNICKNALSKHCQVHNRFTIIDVLTEIPDVYQETDITSFRDNIGNNYLQYGASYYPYLKTFYTYFYSDESVFVEFKENYYEKILQGFRIYYVGNNFNCPLVNIVLHNSSKCEFRIIGEETLNITFPDSGCNIQTFLSSWRNWRYEYYTHNTPQEYQGFDIESNVTTNIQQELQLTYKKFNKSIEKLIINYNSDLNSSLDNERPEVTIKEFDDYREHHEVNFNSEPERLTITLSCNTLYDTIIDQWNEFVSNNVSTFELETSGHEKDESFPLSLVHALEYYERESHVFYKHENMTITKSYPDDTGTYQILFTQIPKENNFLWVEVTDTDSICTLNISCKSGVKISVKYFLDYYDDDTTKFHPFLIYKGEEITDEAMETTSLPTSDEPITLNEDFRGRSKIAFYNWQGNIEVIVGEDYYNDKKIYRVIVQEDNSAQFIRISLAVSQTLEENLLKIDYQQNATRDHLQRYCHFIDFSCFGPFESPELNEGSDVNINLVDNSVEGRESLETNGFSFDVSMYSIIEVTKYNDNFNGYFDDYCLYIDSLFNMSKEDLQYTIKLRENPLNYRYLEKFSLVWRDKLKDDWFLEVTFEPVNSGEEMITFNLDQAQDFTWAATYFSNLHGLDFYYTSENLNENPQVMFIRVSNGDSSTMFKEKDSTLNINVKTHNTYKDISDEITTYSENYQLSSFTIGGEGDNSRIDFDQNSPLEISETNFSSTVQGMSISCSQLIDQANVAIIENSDNHHNIGFDVKNDLLLIKIRAIGYTSVEEIINEFQAFDNKNDFDISFGNISVMENEEQLNSYFESIVQNLKVGYTGFLNHNPKIKIEYTINDDQDDYILSANSETLNLIVKENKVTADDIIEAEENSSSFITPFNINDTYEQQQNDICITPTEESIILIKSLLKYYITTSGLIITHKGREDKIPKVKIQYHDDGGNNNIIFEILGSILIITIPAFNGVNGITVGNLIQQWTLRSDKRGFNIQQNNSELNIVFELTETELTSSPLSYYKFNNTNIYNEVKNKINSLNMILPPSGAIAGIYSKTDKTRGVWKSPANITLNSVLSPTIKINDQLQEFLGFDSTGKSINVIRTFLGKGTLIWGARTISGNDNKWRYLAVRRLFNYIENSIKRFTRFAIFEHNNALTWLKIKSISEIFLERLWKQGAMVGQSAEEAFFINVGLNKTMTQKDILEGRIIIEIGIAPVHPTEFIILRFSHQMQK